ncbi:MAG: AprI/Inh family metalloprotease inhibitor [Hyphomicrobiales bacterium]|nr:AprI/Inh family metalloprotease inhibitor [Hyphomicrobiales bacterium]
MAKKNSLFIIAGFLVVGAVLSGCNRSLNSITPVAPPRALPSTPAERVSSNQLPPVNSNQQPPTEQSLASAPTTPENQKEAQNVQVTANSNQDSSSIKISREALAGSWQVPTDGLDCRIILAFTKWSGGYRAATRKCVSQEMQAVNAWDVKDQTVVLVDQSGNEIARLFAKQTGRYDGRTASGEAVSFVR